MGRKKKEIIITPPIIEKVIPIEIPEFEDWELVDSIDIEETIAVPEKKSNDIDELWNEYADNLELEELAIPQKKKRGKPKKGTNFVIRFTNEDTKEIIENTVRFGRSDKRIYSLILIWLTSFYKDKRFKILRNLSGGSIFVHDFDKNTEEIKTIVHDIIVALCRTGENKKGLTGLKHKIFWDWRENQIIAFVYRFVMFSLFQCMSRVYRQSKASNNLFNERKKPAMQKINKIASAMSDPSLTAVESINEIKKHGVSDEELYTYRHLFAMGDFDNFCSLSDDLLNKIEGSESSLNQIEESEEQIKNKKLYDLVAEVVNSNEVTKPIRDFLKAYYQIPTISENAITGEKFEFTQDLGDFIKYHPEYVFEFCDLEDKQKVPKNPIKKLNIYKVDNSNIYKLAHEKIKDILTSEMKKINLVFSH